MSTATAYPNRRPESGVRRPTVALVMATYNRAGMIGEAIDSLLDQTRALDAFYIIDDGSTDDTREVVESYGDRITLVSQANSGRAAAFNRVIPRVTADYIWLFDDDDIALVDALQIHLDFLAGNPNTDFSYSPHYYFEHSADSGPENKPVSSLPDLPPEEFFLWMMSSHFAPVQLQGMLIPTACYRQDGPFDESLFRSQDRDMMMRIARHFRAGRIATPTWGFRQHDGARGAPGTQRHDASNRYAVWRSYKHAVFTKLHSSVALSEYLTAQADDDAPILASGTPAYRQALLQRAVIMSIHGLAEHALEDFRAFCDELTSSSDPLTAWEQKQISALAVIHNLESMLPSRYFFGLGRAAQPQATLLRLLLRGAYWSIAREVKARNLLNACLMGKAPSALGAGFSVSAYSKRRTSLHHG